MCRVSGETCQVSKVIFSPFSLSFLNNVFLLVCYQRSLPLSYVTYFFFLDFPKNGNFKYSGAELQNCRTMQCKDFSFLNAFFL